MNKRINSKKDPRGRRKRKRLKNQKKTTYVKTTKHSNSGVEYDSYTQLMVDE